MSWKEAFHHRARTTQGCLDPAGIPYELVKAFCSVGFSWGGDWGNNGWIDLVEKLGIGWDERVNLPGDWGSAKRYVDPMHFELTSR